MDLAESTLLAAALHVGLLVVSARWVPAIGDVEEEPLPTRYEVVRFEPIPMADPGEIDELPAATVAAERDPDGRERVDSRCGEHLGGSMGERDAAAEDRRYGVQGTVDNPDPHIARFPWREPSHTFPMIGLIEGNPWGGDPEAPMAEWGRDNSDGNDPASARGHMWGETVGVAVGSPGAGIGLRRYCPTCGDDGRGAAPRPIEGLVEGGATGTERAGGVR
jgi:hypothetical protein